MPFKLSDRWAKSLRRGRARERVPGIGAEEMRFSVGVNRPITSCTIYGHPETPDQEQALLEAYEHNDTCGLPALSGLDIQQLRIVGCLVLSQLRECCVEIPSMDEDGRAGTHDQCQRSRTPAVRFVTLLINTFARIANRISCSSAAVVERPHVDVTPCTSGTVKTTLM